MSFKQCVPPPDREKDHKTLADCMALAELATKENFDDFEGRMLDLLDKGEISGANCFKALVAMRQRVFGGPGMRFISEDGDDVPASLG